MNSSKYTDKQITELSKSPAHNFFDDDDDDEEPQMHSFNFHPIHSSQPHSTLDGIHLRGWSSMDQIGSTKFSREKVRIFKDVSLISEIDKTMKEHTDVLLHAVECLSARLCQMESRTHQLENAIDDLKGLIEFNQGKSNGKFRELENIIIEVQGGIQDLRDEQGIIEAELRLANLQVPKDDLRLETRHIPTQSSLGKETLSSTSQESRIPLPIPAACSQQLPTPSYNVENLPVQSHTPTTPALTAPQIPSQFIQNVMPSIPLQQFCCPPVNSPESAHVQYHATPTLQSLPSSYTHHLHQTPPPIPRSSQLSQVLQVQLPFSLVNSPPHCPSSHRPEVPYLPSHIGHRSSQPPMRFPPPQQVNLGSSQQIHHQLLNWHYFKSSTSSQAQWPEPQEQANSMDFYGFGASPRCSSSLTMKSLQPLPSPLPGGQSSYSHLPTARILPQAIPTAQILPQAIPTASSVDTGLGSGGGGNRVPVDDVVDKVVAMGFRRDLVKATVKKLMENGQSVDLNAVLDKLMSNG